MPYERLNDLSGYFPPARALVWWEAHNLRFGPSPFTGAQQTLHQWGRWRASYTYDQLNYPDAASLHAFFERFSLGDTPFTITDPLHLRPLRGVAVNGQGQVKTQPLQNARTVVTKWTGVAGGAALLHAGDMVSFATTLECFRLTADAVATDPTTVTLSLAQPIRRPPAVNEALVVVDPLIRVTLVQLGPLTYSAPNMCNFEAQMVEDLTYTA